MGSSVAVGLIGQLLRLIITFQEKQIELEGKKEMVKNLGLQNDAVKSAVGFLENEFSIFSESNVQAIAASVGAPAEDNEYRERLKLSTRIMGELIREGLEVHPALSAPTEMKDTYPTPAQLAGALRLLPGPEKELEDESNKVSS